jgi:hypothetical protein
MSDPTIPTPSSITPELAKILTAKMMLGIKRLDCSLYNQCLEVAIKGDWPGFTCNYCTAHMATDTFQKVQDFLGLSAVSEAADNVHKMGKAGRRVGVKPGEKKKLKVIVNPVIKEIDESNMVVGEGECAPIVDAFPEL